MAVTVGTDLVHVPRLARSLGRATFLDRAFTPAEQEFCAGRADRFAGRWAVKEAAMKALHHGLGEVAMTEIEVEREPSGAPILRLHGRAAALAAEAGWISWAVSIAHDGDYATAVVVAQTRSVPD